METLHVLIERFGLIAIFAGCLAEGESAAILGGFFAHQKVFSLVGALTAIFAGAFIGDSAIFLAGRKLSRSERVTRLTQRPGFGRALKLLEKHPVAYVLLNRYVYGFRLVGGVAAGLSKIPMAAFLILNAIASLIWACLFLSVGFVFGVGAEKALGGELAMHQRVITALIIGVVVAVMGGLAAHHFARRG